MGMRLRLCMDAGKMWVKEMMGMRLRQCTDAGKMWVKEMGNGICVGFCFWL
jgi:hypothetical protein